MDLYRALLAHFGPQHWWPGDTPFEVAVGAILTQQAAWTNVELAIANLKGADMLEPASIANADRELVEELIRPSGFYRQKAGYLMAFCRHIVEKHGGSIGRMLDRPLEHARKELLELRGIGPETADSILLYAGNHPTFVVDAYTVRVCRRTGMLDTGKYYGVKEFFEARLGPDPALYNEFHALFVALGKHYCTARRPDCGNCPVPECAYRDAGRRHDGARRSDYGSG